MHAWHLIWCGVGSNLQFPTFQILHKWITHKLAESKIAVYYPYSLIDQTIYKKKNGTQIQIQQNLLFLIFSLPLQCLSQRSTQTPLNNLTVMNHPYKKIKGIQSLILFYVLFRKKNNYSIKIRKKEEEEEDLKRKSQRNW